MVDWEIQYHNREFEDSSLFQESTDRGFCDDLVKPHTKTNLLATILIGKGAMSKWGAKGALSVAALYAFNTFMQSPEGTFTNMFGSSGSKPPRPSGYKKSDNRDMGEPNSYPSYDIQPIGSAYPSAGWPQPFNYKQY